MAHFKNGEIVDVNVSTTRNCKTPDEILAVVKKDKPLSEWVAGSIVKTRCATRKRCFYEIQLTTGEKLTTTARNIRKVKRKHL
jgi:ribosomal protein S8